MSEKIEELKKEISAAVEDNLNNKKLQKALREEFVRKNFPETIPSQLFSESLDDEFLNKRYLIAITKVFKNMLDDEKFKLTKYFTEGELRSYDSAINTEELVVDYLLFKDMIQLDSKNYEGVLDSEMAYMMRKNSLYNYYRDMQRAPKLVKTSAGRVVKKIDANIKNILDMEEEFSKGTMRPTAIHFGILVKNSKGLAENFKFKKMYKNIGDMWIKPDFDYDSPTYLPFISVDGWHRLNALCNAVERGKLEGKEVKAKLGVMIHIFNSEAEAKKFVADSFKRVTTDLDYLNAIQPSDEKVFVKEFEDESRWLKNKVALTKQELNMTEKYTEQKILIDAFKNTDIEMSETVQSEFDREKIAEIIDNLLDFVLSKVFNNDLSIMKKSIFLNKNIFKLYIKFAAMVKDIKYSSAIYTLVQNIDNNEEILKSVFETINEYDEYEKILREGI